MTYCIVADDGTQCSGHLPCEATAMQEAYERTAPAGYPTHAKVQLDVEILLDQCQEVGAPVDVPAARAHAAQSWDDACFTVQELVRRIGAAVAERKRRAA